MPEQKKLNFNFSVIEPLEAVMAAARENLASADENRRAVAKALLDVTALGISVKNAMLEDRDIDLAPYLDFWFADAIICAERLVKSDDEKARFLGESLIAAEKSVVKSKESLLAEFKRLGIKPGGK